jgi:hypothetical protein
MPAERGKNRERKEIIRERKGGCESGRVQERKNRRIEDFDLGRRDVTCMGACLVRVWCVDLGQRAT